MLKHNKKRNSFIVYEQLMTLASTLVASNKIEEAKYVISIVKKHFSPKSVLGQEKKFFETLLKYRATKEQCLDLIEETLKQVSKQDLNKIKQANLALLEDINHNISQDLYNIPVKDFKLMASVQILFTECRNEYADTTPVERVKIHNVLVEHMTQSTEEAEEPLDNITYKMLVKKYNETYYPLVNQHQKDILKGLALFHIKNDSQSFSSLVEQKINVIKDCLKNHTKSDEMIKEAYNKICSHKYDFTNEEHIYEVLRYLDLVEDLENV